MRDYEGERRVVKRQRWQALALVVGIALATALIVWFLLFLNSLFIGDRAQAAPKRDQPLTKKQKFKRDRRKLRKATPRNPIPRSISYCESGTSGGYRAYNESSGAGGKYQIIPSTWRGALPRKRLIRLAEGQLKRYRGAPAPHRASPLLQDIVAGIIWDRDGPSAWSCS